MKNIYEVEFKNEVVKATIVKVRAHEGTFESSFGGTSRRFSVLVNIDNKIEGFATMFVNASSLEKAQAIIKAQGKGEIELKLNSTINKEDATKVNTNIVFDDALSVDADYVITL